MYTHSSKLHIDVHSTWICTPHGCAKGGETESGIPSVPWIHISVSTFTELPMTVKNAKSLIVYLILLLKYSLLINISQLEFFFSLHYTFSFSVTFLFFSIFFFQEIFPFGTIQYCLCSDSVSMTSLSCFCQNKSF